MHGPFYVLGVRMGLWYTISDSQQHEEQRLKHESKGRASHSLLSHLSTTDCIP